MAVPRYSDGYPVARISTLLEAVGRTPGQPVRLAENAGMAFIGCYALGMGFVLDPEEAQEWIAVDARNAEVLFPYLSGEDLNSRPDSSASRWVIDFNDWPEDVARSYERPYARLKERVKPERQRRKPDGQYALRRPLPQRWWQYAEKRPAMRQAISTLSEVLVIARVSNTVMPLRASTAQVFHEKVVVFATDSYATQAILSSSFHQLWAIKYGTTLRTDNTYTPDLVFGSLPRPEPTEQLEEVGRALDSERRKIMAHRGIGATRLYGQINDCGISGDSQVAQLRDLHVAIDEATLGAYGWSDLDLEHGFYDYRQVTRWTVSPRARVELLDRLLEENHHRASDHPASPAPTPSQVPEVTLFD
ncbi:type IIL restriction-modification enzyme MmeI [Propionibacteriaceae bacterium Y1923]